MKPRSALRLLSSLLLMLAAALPASAYDIYPFNPMGPAEPLATGVSFHFNYPYGSLLALTTEEGFHLYDFDAEQWVDHTWPGWVGKALYDVAPVPGTAQTLALGGVNAFFKGVLKLSPDLGVSDDLVHESTGGRVTCLAPAQTGEPVVFACTWSDVVDGELLRSDDGGATYAPLSGHGHHAMSGIAAFTDQEIYVTGDNYVTRSLDGGATWENLRGNLPEGLPIHCLAAPQPVTALPKEGGQPAWITAGLLLVSNDDGVYMTWAGNIDWERILDVPCRAVAYRFMQVDTFVYWSEYYAVTMDGRLLVCLNENWDNWVDATAMIAPAQPIDLACNLGPVYVATRSHGVYVSNGIDGASPVPAAPKGLSLSARPNPFNPATELAFTVPRDGRAVIVVYDLAGREVAEVFAGDLTTGAHTVTWQPRGLASGTYHAVLRQGGHQAAVRVSLIK